MTSDLRRGHDLETSSLAAFLRQELGLSAPTIERVAGGQSNPTFFVTCGRRRMVLRKQPGGDIMPSAHAVDREYKVIAALAQTEVPVPQPILFCADRTVIGTTFYLMERLEGRVLHDNRLSAAPPGQRRAMYDSMAETLARLHAVDWRAAGLADFGRGANYFARQIALWARQWQLCRTREIPEIDETIAWLEQHCPPDDGLATIVHGDFRIGNMMFAPNSARIIGVLDWELSTIGHPLADLAHGCTAWRTAADEFGGLLDLDLARLDLPTEQDYVRRYRAEARHEGELASFHIVLALLRFAVIFEGIAARASVGNAAADDAHDIGRHSQAFARRALHLTRGVVTAGASPS